MQAMSQPSHWDNGTIKYLHRLPARALGNQFDFFSLLRNAHSTMTRATLLFNALVLGALAAHDADPSRGQQISSSESWMKKPRQLPPDFDPSKLPTYNGTGPTMLRFGCHQLSIDRIDPLVNPGSIPSPHQHQIVGGDAFDA